MKNIILFILMMILFLGGIPLLLGELNEFTLITYVVAKCIGLIAVYSSYVIYVTEFVNYDEPDNKINEYNPRASR